MNPARSHSVRLRCRRSLSWGGEEQARPGQGGHEPPAGLIPASQLAGIGATDGANALAGLEPTDGVQAERWGRRTSVPSQARSGSGTMTEPSGCWFCSTIAGRRRLVARPEALRVWT